jgi:hypothetical protein
VHWKTLVVTGSERKLRELSLRFKYRDEAVGNVLDLIQALCVVFAVEPDPDFKYSDPSRSGVAFRSVLH